MVVINICNLLLIVVFSSSRINSKLPRPYNVTDYRADCGKSLPFGRHLSQERG